MHINNGLQTAKRVEHDSVDLNKYQFMKKDLKRNDILRNNSVRMYLLKFKCLQK